MKKIAFIIGNIDKTGGTEKMTSVIANGLSGDENYEIYIYSLNKIEKNPFFSIKGNIKIIYAEKERKENKYLEFLRCVVEIRKFIKKYKIDIVIDVDVCLDLYTILAKTFTKTKLISWDHFSFDKDNPYYYYSNRARKFTAKFSDYIIVISNCYIEDYKRLYNIKSNIKCIYNPNENKIYDNYDVENKNIITVGSLVNIKGVDMIPTIGEKIFNEYPEWRWNICGDGELREKIQQDIIKKKLEKNIILKGKIKNINNEYQNSSIYVLTSRDESFGMVLLEAKSNRLPIVASNVQGTKEIVRNNVDGYIVEKNDVEDFADKIKELIDNKNKRIEFSKNTNENLNKFDYNKILSEWKKLLNEMGE